MRTAYHSYLATTAYYQESAPIAKSELDAMVRLLRSGDTSVADAIIRGHLKMVAAIVGKMVRSRRRADDALSAALIALVEAVRDAPAALYDDEITAYITSCVKFKVKEYLGSDHVVRVPTRTIRRKLAAGDQYETLVAGSDTLISDRDPFDGDEDAVPKKGMTLPFHIPVAKPTAISLEFQEAARRAAKNPMEVAILNLRMSGHTTTEIGPKVGLSQQRISQMLDPIVKRFEAAYA